MPPKLLRLMRYAGWIALLASCGVVAGALLVQVPGGLGDDLWPSERLWRYLFTSVWMSAAATLMALVLALPAVYALVRAPRPWQRGLLLSLTLLPLLTMPAIFAYAWALLASSEQPLVAAAMGLFGWRTPGLEPLHAAWVLANWLWPIPALILAASFRHSGAGSYRLACLETTAPRAFLRAALPVMRAPLCAACAIVFILAALDSSIGPLLFANETWSVEMLACASVAGPQERPAAFLFARAWPMLALVALLMLVALPGLRQMAAWADESESLDTGAAPSGGLGAWLIPALLAAALTLLPIAVFAFEMAGDRYTPGQAFRMAFDLFRAAGLSSLVVAFCAALAAMAVALASLDEPSWPLPLRLVGLGVLALVLFVAVLPPPMIGATLAAVFTSDWISPSDRWNLYDNTPVAWIAAMLARFAFLPVCIVRLLNRRVPEEIASQARTDGADRMQCLAAARLPMLWRGLFAGVLAVAGLTLSEIPASSLVQPPQWGHGSLAVLLDGEMHYGRRAPTIALSLLMMLPALVAAVALPLLARRPTLRRTNGRTADSGPRGRSITRAPRDPEP